MTPGPVPAGLNPAASAWPSGRSGNTLAIVWSAFGIWLSGTKMPERK